MADTTVADTTHAPSRVDRVLGWLGVPAAGLGVRGRQALLLALAVALLGWLAALLFMSTVPLSGDEPFYAENAAAIADLLTGRGGSLRKVAGEVVSNGWFMPGTSLLLTPLYVVDPAPALAGTRTYVAVIVVLLWVWALREVATTFGRTGVVAFLVFPTLAAMWLVFATTAWGDLPAGLLLAITAARAFRLMSRVFTQRPFDIREVIVLEVVMAAMVYLRGNTIVAVMAIHALVLGAAVISGQWSRLLQRVGMVAIGGVVFAACLAPWSLAASRVLGDTVLTTSSAPLSLGITFGDTDEICFGPCPGKGVWYWAVQFSRTYGEEHGISELEAQRRMSAHALRDLTFSGYARQARDNFGAFITPTGEGPRRGRPFMARFAHLSTRDLSPAVQQRTVTAVRVMTLLLYVPFFVALVLANAMVFFRSRRLQLLSLCVKALTISLFLQPFLHRSHSRYWVAFAPLMTLAAVLLAEWWSQRRVPVMAGATNDQPPEPDSLDGPAKLMLGAQVAYVALIVAVALALVLA